MLGEACFGLQGCSTGSSPAFWTLLYDCRFPTVCDMPVALGDGLSLLTFLLANKCHALFSFLRASVIAVLKVIFASRFGPIYSRARRKLCTPVHYEGVQLRTISGVVNVHKKQEGGLGGFTSEAESLRHYCCVLNRYHRRSLLRSTTRPTAHDCACGFIDRASSPNGERLVCTKQLDHCSSWVVTIVGSL